VFQISAAYSAILRLLGARLTSPHDECRSITGSPAHAIATWATDAPISLATERSCSVLLQLHLILSAQYPIQIECGANQCKMCEGLRKIPQRLALRPCLLCVESEMIGITQHTFEQ
jgi:hypothetical protein